jgi:hypothetical protein
MLVRAGPLDKYVGKFLSQDLIADSVPEHTLLLPLDDEFATTPYRKASRTPPSLRLLPLINYFFTVTDGQQQKAC